MFIRLHGLVLLLLISSICEAAPQVKQFFPDHPVLLGDPLIWTIRIQYPLWESCQLSLSHTEGIEMRIDGPTLSESEGQITADYRVRITAQSLSVKDVPSALITDQRGQSTVISGKPIQVHSISGDSLQIRNPPPLQFPQPGRNRFWLFCLLGILFLLLAVLVEKRAREKSPRRLLIRNLVRARADIQKGKMPPPIWRLLRSELLWGFPAETHTPSQLKTLAENDGPLAVIAASLLSLEAWRYSGASAPWDSELVLKSVDSAIELAAGKGSWR